MVNLILIFLLYLEYNIPCIFKKTFNIPCPGCGLTRAFKCIIKFKIIKSLSYNILAIPLLSILTMIFIFNLIDLIYNKQLLNKFINIIYKHSYVIILLLIISWILNIYKQI